MPNPNRLMLAVVLSSAFLAFAGPSADASTSTLARIRRTPTPTPIPSATPTPTPGTTGATFVKIYANVLNNTQASVTPEDVQSTSDGGYIALAITQAPQSLNAVGVSWLVKLDSSGNAQWQKELGCFGTPPGDYADGVSMQQTADGGYVVGGGTIGCGSGSICPSSSGIQCGLVEKLDSTGTVTWAHVYLAGAAGTAITRISRTTDAGYIAVGSATDAAQNTGALILKLDSLGNVQWQRELGPSGSTQAYFNAVQQTSDGGFVAAGEFYVPSAGTPRTSVLVVKLDSSGTMQWQLGFNHLSSSGSPDAVEHALSVIQSADGGFAVAGNWTNSTQPGQCCSGALLLKLQADGSIQWQNAYSGGVYCFFNGFNETCTTIGGVIYSLHQTADAGYVLAGSGELELTDSVPLVPWAAKVDASGNLVWQHFYYQTNPATGRTLSQYFASSTLTSGGALAALGFTENLTNGLGELYAVRTDNSGLVGTCNEVRNATPLKAINPALTSTAPSLGIQTAIVEIGNSPATTLSTSIKSTRDC